MITESRILLTIRSCFTPHFALLTRTFEHTAHEVLACVYSILAASNSGIANDFGHFSTNVVEF